MKEPSTRARAALVTALVLGLNGCHKPPPKEQGASSAAAASSAAPIAVGPPSAALSAPPLPVLSRDPICRALRVTGDVRRADVPLSSGAELDGHGWITLAAGASFTLKHSSSGRELAFSGPARLLACRRGREQVLLAQGRIEVGAGMGARPGAEVLVATPIAALRYADADFGLSLDDKRLEVTVRAGQVEVDPALPAQVGLKTPLRARDKLRLPLGKPNPTALMAACKEAAEAAESSARRVADKTATESLGERAQANVRARRAARASCSIAAAATGLVADPTASAGLWAESERWEALWESIPRKVGAPGPEK